MEGILAKKAGEMVFGAITQPEPDEQEGGKKKNKRKGSSDKDKDKDKEGASQNSDVWTEIKRAIFEGGNIKEKTFFENEFNYPIIILGLLILKIYKDNN